MKVTCLPSSLSNLCTFSVCPWEKRKKKSSQDWTVFCWLCSQNRTRLPSTSRPTNLHVRSGSWRRSTFVVGGKNNRNLAWERVDLIRRWTKALPLFWTSSRPMSSPWWYIIPLGRQVNYKLALLGIGGARHLKAVWLWRGVFMCVGSEEAVRHCYPNCQSHFHKTRSVSTPPRHAHTGGHVHARCCRGTPLQLRMSYYYDLKSAFTQVICDFLFKQRLLDRALH